MNLWFQFWNRSGCGHLLADLTLLCLYLLKWAILTIPLGWTIGSACAGFLWSLDAVTHFRINHPWLLFCLPPLGALSALMYRWLGPEAEAGSNLVIDAIHEPATTIPPRMAPLVYAGTTQAQAPFGNGVRCVGGTIVRLGVANTQSGQVDVALLAGDPLLQQINAGSPRYFQAWYRQASIPGAGFNLTDGVRL